MAFGGNGAGGTDGEEIVSQINITPLTDIFVVLLIIFMVTAEHIVQAGPRVELPATYRVSQVPFETAVTITPERKYFVDGRPLAVEGGDLRELEEALAASLAKSKEKNLMIQADKRLLVREVVRVMELAAARGVRKIGIGTELALPPGE